MNPNDRNPKCRRNGLATAISAACLALAGNQALAEDEIWSSADGTGKLTFSVDVYGAFYQSTDSWFGESQSFLGADTDGWADFGAEPTLSLESELGNGTLFGQVSAVYSSTYGDDASGLTVGLDDTHELKIEQGHVGWRSEDMFAGMEGDSLTVTIGRQDYNAGTGLLLNDGGGDGGERGGWYLGLRKAFSESVVASFETDSWLAEGFTLKNRPREGGTQGEVMGFNVEYSFSDDFMLGGNYLVADSNLPGSVDLDVMSVRFDLALDNGLGFAGEYVDQSSSQIEAQGYYGEVRYTTMDTAWSPVFSYRYAAFDGDNPGTAVDERYRDIAYGFTDYGYWYQGEITGEYVLSNGNLTSHMLRMQATPSEDLTLNIFYYDFSLDQPSAFGVASDDWGDEINFALDWSASDSLYVVGVIGMLMPGAAAEQWVGGSSDWIHAMLYLTYSW